MNKISEFSSADGGGHLLDVQEKLQKFLLQESQVWREVLRLDCTSYVISLVGTWMFLLYNWWDKEMGKYGDDATGENM
jgi:hypothetical protein